jgi:6-phosphogluconolactonase
MNESADGGPAESRVERPVVAGTFVYVSNAEDGDIGMYAARGRFAAAGTALQGGKARDADGGEPGQALCCRRRASNPFQAYSYSIDRSRGSLNLVGTGTRRELSIHRV